MKVSTTVLQSLLAMSIAQATSASFFSYSTPALRRYLQEDEDEDVDEDVNEEEDEDEDEEEEEIPTKRDCEMKTKGQDKVEFECKTKTESGNMEMKDKIKFKVSHDNEGLKVKVEYEQETEMDRRLQDGEIEETEVETSYEVVFGSIVEYENSGSTAGRRLTPVEEAYDFETSTIVKTLSLDSWSGFTEPAVTRRRLQSGEEDTVYTFSLSTFDQVANFDFTIAQSGAANAAATANSMKIDVTLNSFPWSSSSSNLAILSNVETEREVSVEYADEEDEDEEEEEEDGEGEEEEEEPAEEPDEQPEEEDEGEGRRRRRRRLNARETEEITISFADALAATNIMPFGEVTWAKTAEVPSETADSNSTAPEISVMQLSTEDQPVTIQVVATTPQDSSEQLAFSFVGSPAAKGAPSIYWDPQTGVNYAPAATANGAPGSGSSAFMLTGSVALALSAAVAFLW